MYFRKHSQAGYAVLADLKLLNIFLQENCSCLTALPALYVSCVRNMIANNIPAIAHCIWADKRLKEEMQKLLFQEIDLELKNLCSNTDTTFRTECVNSLPKKIDFEAQEKELWNRCPTFAGAIFSAACNKRNLKRNKVKTEDSIKPRVMTAVGILLHSRSQRMNLHQLLHSLVLRRAGAKKSAFWRLNALSVTLSYPDTLKKQSAMGVGFDSAVLEWMKELAEQTHSDWDIIDIEEQKANNQKPKASPCRFRLLGDNCDLRNKCRTTTRTKAGADKHLFINLAIRDRVAGKADANYGYHPEKSYCPSLFLPSVEDNHHLRSEFKIIVGRVIKNHVKEMNWLENFIPDHIPHENSKLTKQKSEIVSYDTSTVNRSCHSKKSYIMQMRIKYIVLAFLACAVNHGVSWEAFFFLK